MTGVTAPVGITWLPIHLHPPVVLLLQPFLSNTSASHSYHLRDLLLPLLSSFPYSRPVILAFMGAGSSAVTGISPAASMDAVVIPPHSNSTSAQYMTFSPHCIFAVKQHFFFLSCKWYCLSEFCFPEYHMSLFHSILLKPPFTVTTVVTPTLFFFLPVSIHLICHDNHIW